MKESWA